jgi:hypothetical protein
MMMSNIKELIIETDLLCDSNKQDYESLEDEPGTPVRSILVSGLAKKSFLMMELDTARGF